MSGDMKTASTEHPKCRTCAWWGRAGWPWPGACMKPGHYHRKTSGDTHYCADHEPAIAQGEVVLDCSNTRAVCSTGHDE